MPIYTLVLYLHVIGDIGLFVGLGVALYGLAALRKAERVEQVRPIVHLMHAAERLYTFAGPLLLLSGAYLTETTWGWDTAWIDVALGSLLLMLPLGPFIVGPRVQAIRKAADAASDGPLPGSLAAQVRDPLLGTAQRAVAGVMLGVVFLMTVKPALNVSILAIAVGLLLGAASGLPLWWSPRRRAGIAGD